jgi:carbonic anhydrase/acetyltransferase-like protein (isoleucine patch superfamily)
MIGENVAIYQYGTFKPVVGNGCYISDSARVIGNVILEDGCYVGHGAIIRADHGIIHIGQGCAIEENVVIHVRVGQKYVLEEKVTLGHGAIIHGDVIKAFAVIGMGAVVGRETSIGRWAVVAEGAVVPTGKSVEDETIVAGIPAKVIGKVNSKHKEYWKWAKQVYNNLARDYENNLKKLY